MSFEGSEVFFAVLCCLVEKYVISLVLHVVVEPLLCVWDGECVAERNLDAYWWLRAGAQAKEEGPTPCIQREYDNTLGYPGEDGRQSLNLFAICNLLWHSSPL
jgi:hypothetical protein